MDTLRTIHGHNKFLVLLLLAVTLVRLLTTWLGKKDYGKLDRALYGATLGFVGLLVLAGVALIISMGFGPPHRMEHLGIMLIAYATLHVPLRFKARPGPERARIGVTCIALSAALVGLGLFRLPFPFFPGKAPAPAPASTAP